MTPFPRREARARAALAIASLLAAAAIALGAGAVTGASPEPSADPGRTNIEAWLDVPIRADATVGESYAFGVTLWDTAQNRFAEFNQAYVRLHPAKGSAKPTVGEASSDWPGHLIADVVVPAGGAGTIEIGLSDQVCTIRGSVETCAGQEFPFRMAGTGPPPDAPLAALVDTALLAPQAQVAAGELVDVAVDVVPRGGWELQNLGLPDRLVAFISESRGGQDLATTELHASSDPRPEPGLTYTGQIQIPEPGNLRLTIAIPGNGTEDQVLGTPLRLTATGTGDAASPRPPAASGSSPAPSQPAPPWPLILGGLAVLVVGGIVISRVFADL